MKRYTIGLTLLFALMNTGCEDAKAESKDYDVEIVELQQQITQLSSRLDSLITVVPTNTNIAQLNSRLDSLINVVPTRYVYEGDGDPWDDEVRIDIPFDFETNDSKITWWIKDKIDGDWSDTGSGWFVVIDNQTYFTQCGDCATKWKCIIINYGETG
jgi:hypothetical protein